MFAQKRVGHNKDPPPPQKKKRIAPSGESININANVHLYSDAFT